MLLFLFLTLNIIDAFFLEFFIVDFVKSVRIRSFFWSIFSLNAGKYETEKTPYLDNLLAVKNIFFHSASTYTRVSTGKEVS